MMNKIKTILIMTCLLVICLPMTSYASTDNTVTISGFTYSYYDDASRPEYNKHSIFTSSTGNPVYCGNHGLFTPVGDSLGDSKKLTMHSYDNEMVRKILYYGYLGPKEWEGFSDNRYNGVYKAVDNESKRKWCGNAVTGIALTKTQGKGYFYEVAGFNAFWDYVSKAPSPPSGFKAYIMYGGNTLQDLFTWTYNPVGTLSLEKGISKNTHIFNLFKEYYSLEGATYSVSTDNQCKNIVGYIKTDNNGMSNEISLTPGIYYVRETNAPKGFLIDKNIYSIEVKEDNNSMLKVVDELAVNNIEILLQKQDEDKGTGLKDAIFKVNYYKEVTEDVTKLEPTNTWYFKTDDDGLVLFEEEYMVDGDSLYKDDLGRVISPIGTYEIMEEKAPEGYIRTEESAIRHVIWNQDSQSWETYNCPVFKNSVEEIPDVPKEEPTEDNTEKSKVETSRTIPNTGDTLQVSIYLSVISISILVYFFAKKYAKKY